MPLRIHSKSPCPQRKKPHDRYKPLNKSYHPIHNRWGQQKSLNGWSRPIGQLQTWHSCEACVLDTQQEHDVPFHF
ncbi:hypothetical protein Y1Q_0009976 [Alligator mississippiensis]|uniref:Uncharacterized protein n=1 Tax=Alligator mississippiensis TaxID=8496 RepID=A0A151MXG4_ALLMI|nr:hypothetical protein Y1Q_0009976 [Alligator mississippiensis]